MRVDNFFSFQFYFYCHCADYRDKKIKSSAKSNNNNKKELNIYMGDINRVQEGRPQASKKLFQLKIN